MKLIIMTCGLVFVLLISSFANPAPDGRTFIVAISPYLDRADAESVFTNLFEYCVSKARQGDVIAVWDGLALTPVVQFTIPTGAQMDNPIARTRRLASSLARLRAWLLAARPHDPVWSEALDVPAFLNLASTQLREGRIKPLAVVFVGSPFYIGSAGNISPFMMRDGYVPTDVCFGRPRDESPFASTGKDTLLGISVGFVYLRESTFTHDENRYACGRFYTLLCELSGARLASFAAAASVALTRACEGVTEPCLRGVTVNPADNAAMMRKVIFEPRVSQKTNSVSSTSDQGGQPVREVTFGQSKPAPQTRTAISNLGDPTPFAAQFSVVTNPPIPAISTSVIPPTPKGRIGIGCVWASPDAKDPTGADVDLYIYTPEGETLYYRNQDATSGHYFRDIKSGNSALASSAAWKDSWEYVELRDLSESDLSKLRCSLNVFRGSGARINGTLQVSRGERKALQSFEFETPVGNHGEDPSQRPSPFWKDVDIAALLAKAVGSSEQKPAGP